jgi:hypothetical protein
MEREASAQLTHFAIEACQRNRVQILIEEFASPQGEVHQIVTALVRELFKWSYAGRASHFGLSAYRCF